MGMERVEYFLVVFFKGRDDAVVERFYDHYMAGHMLCELFGSGPVPPLPKLDGLGFPFLEWIACEVLHWDVLVKVAVVRRLVAVEPEVDIGRILSRKSVHDLDRRALVKLCEIIAYRNLCY
jgi:hypothetical protein